MTGSGRRDVPGSPTAGSGDLRPAGGLNPTSRGGLWLRAMSKQDGEGDGRSIRGPS
jgi:hypothetical protein